jgi:hypothetical protein
MKTCGGVEIQLHHSSPRHYIEVSHQLHAHVALPIVQQAGWAPQPVWILWRNEISLASDRNRTLTSRSSSP